MSKDSPQRVTIYDIGKALGVSHTTVSMALRNNPRISEATRKRVHDKAGELGYRPDPMLAALSSYRISNQEKPTQAALAWVNPFMEPSNLWKSREFTRYHEGAKETAERMGFHLEEFNTIDLPLTRMDTIFKTRNIRGVLLATLCGPGFEDPSIDWKSFPWDDYATVRFGRNLGHPAAHYVTSAQAANAILAFRTIRDRGYKRIGFVGKYSRQRIFSAGISFAQEEIPEEEIIHRLYLSDEETGEQQFQALENWIQANQPDAIFTDRPYLVELLEKMGLRIPKDIAVASTSIHDTPINAGIDQNPRAIGDAAVRTLVSLINGQSTGIPDVRNEIMIEGEWVDGTMLP